MHAPGPPVLHVEAIFGEERLRMAVLAAVTVSTMGLESEWR